jgi:hypothetical protein
LGLIPKIEQRLKDQPKRVSAMARGFPRQCYLLTFTPLF